MEESKPICATCKHLRKSYWGSEYDYGGRTHHCGKSDERRFDKIKPTGDFAEDFMINFRSFFDAKANQCACKYYETRSVLNGGDADVLAALNAAGGRAAYGFFSKENAACEAMSGMFVERDEHSAMRRHPSDGTRDWMINEVGKVEASRIAAISQGQIEEPKQSEGDEVGAAG
jgi:hypothetical protein